jgi:hypothetical protein
MFCLYFIARIFVECGYSYVTHVGYNGFCLLDNLIENSEA